MVPRWSYGAKPVVELAFHDHSDHLDDSPHGEHGNFIGFPTHLIVGMAILGVFRATIAAGVTELSNVLGRVYPLNPFLPGRTGLKKDELVEKAGLRDSLESHLKSFRRFRVIGTGSMQQVPFIIKKPRPSHSRTLCDICLKEEVSHSIQHTPLCMVSSE
jgi:hypothetical protein